MIINTTNDISAPFRIRNILKENKKGYLVYIFAKLIQMVLLVVIPFFLSASIEQLEKGELGISRNLTYFFALSIFEFFITIVVNEWNVRLSNKIAFQIEYNTMRHIKHVPYVLVKDYDDAYLAQRINNDAVLIGDYLVEQLPYFVFDVLFIVTITILTFSINFSLGILITAFLVLLVVLYLTTRKRMYKQGEEMFEAQGDFFAMLSNQFLNILSIKVNAWYKETDSEFVKIVTNFFHKSIKYLRTVNTITAANALICRMAYGSAIVLLGASISNETLSISSFIVVIMYIQLLLSKLQNVTEFGQKREEYRVAEDRVKNFDSLKIESNGEAVLSHISEITAQNISVNYASNTILKNVSVSLKKGCIYVIKGKNGSGKTTLINTLLGVLDTSAGKICYDKQEISDIDMYSARKKLFSVTTQEPYLCNGTLQENLLYGSQVTSDSNTYTSITKDLLAFFDGKEEKENTYITSKNTSLSGGEKQKISICRALLKNSEVLIFDEPTNALDVESIQKFLLYLQEIKSEHIIMIISHNEKVIEMADEVLDLEKISER